jgi:hypothetical protein
LESLTSEQLSGVIPDPVVVKKLMSNIENETHRRKRDEAWIQNLLVDSNL